MDRTYASAVRKALAALRRELRDGCPDSPPGGVEALVQRISARLRHGQVPERAGEALSRLVDDMRGYAQLPAQRRRPLVERALSLLRAVAPQAAQRARRPRAGRVGAPPPLAWDAPVNELSGIGPTRARALERLGIRCVGDLLLHCPTRYDDRRQVLSLRDLHHGQTAVVRVRVAGAGRRCSRRRRAAAVIPVESGGVEGELLFFGQPWMSAQFRPGTELLVVGTARVQSGKAAVVVAEAEPIDPAEPGRLGGLVPIYPTTDGISQRMLRGWIAQALGRCALPCDPLPERLRSRRGLMALSEAIRELHLPSELPAARRARHRLAYGELLALQLVLARRRSEARAPCPASALVADGLIEEFVAALPFSPTAAQRRVLAEVATDLSADEPAHRLVHGDVGSGKTVVAALALAAAARAGRQAALMAPTELLAEQQHETLCELLAPLGIQPVLLTGSVPAGERAAAQAGLATGRTACAVGTHALFTQSVRFADLAVVVIDEQQRFGVRQRAQLSAKGVRPNLFVMSATPIPRTLALAMWGDFDISVLDELPPGRRLPRTRLLPAERRGEAWELVCEQVAAGRQAYVVCPAIEESEQEMAATSAVFEELARGPLAHLRLGLVHGRLGPDRRQAVMGAFRAGEIDVLVATSVVEVGVNVPNATTIVIENAERFGLAQLHQLRGRVVRADFQPHCLLICSTPSEDALERLAVLARTADGFEIAEEDLRRRGPGEMEGLRQSGLPELRIAGLLADSAALSEAHADAFEAIGRDPELAREEHAGLREMLHSGPSGETWTL